MENKITQTMMPMGEVTYDPNMFNYIPKRDLFAALALQGMLANCFSVRSAAAIGFDGISTEFLIAQSVMLADQLIEALNNNKGETK